jgi:4-oxalocrotonate tautomerase
MPIALIKIIQGRDAEKKRKLIESVQAMAESLDMPIDGVRVPVEEYPPESWGRGGKAVADLVAEGKATLPKK